ncbi:proline dehydrogenase [Paenibacillus protaetiae]|uniref:proline dehydrogenase n=1 Tax=Paenibacillus protaetiae TaxID=2509456 RepID=A0A4P6F5L3_9BACL|nr:proline dehydrogenase family protein [Paenibacillus protaetiae]QAY68497.1 proline dehydrogenase [Paenibacillus protaetiae]
MSGNELYRKALLTISGNAIVEKLSKKYGKRLAGKFIAGDTLEQALDETAALNEKGILVTLDHLGEGISHLDEAAGYREEYIRMLDGIARRGVQSHVSLKPTQMGMALDTEACYRNVRAVAAKAKESKNFVRLDMENTPYTQATIDLVLRLHQDGLTNAGTVLQAYLHRSVKDAEEMIRKRVKLRLVKGAYKETTEHAIQSKAGVIDNFKTMIRMHLDKGYYTAIASHDDAIIEWVKQYAADNRIPKDAFEFQMLYGLRMSDQERLAQEGYRIRCYVPYGTMWYPYYTRRLAEKPANLMLVLRHMFH